jgi:hypothetical protein
MTNTSAIEKAVEDFYMTPEDVCVTVPSITKGQLANFRYLGKGGPRYRKLGKKIIYLRSEVIAWVEDSARSGTAAEAL